MKSKFLKKATAVCMTAVMVFSMTACGGKSGGTDKKQAEDTKDYVYAPSPMELGDVQGEISTPILSGDKLYFSTYEWIEEPGAEGADELMLKEDEGDVQESSETEGESDAQESSETEGEGDAQESSETEGEGDVQEETSADAGDVSEDSTEGEVNGHSEYHIYKCNLDGTGLEEIPFVELAENEYFNTWLADPEGNLSFMMSSYDGATTKYSILKVDASGNKVFDEDITKALGADENNYVSSMIMDQEGNYIVLMESKVVIFDKDAKKVNEVKSENWIDGMALTKDGQIVCGTAGEDGAQAQVLDVKKGSFGESYKLDIAYFQSSNSLINGAEYDFYYKDGNCIYGYMIADKKSTKLVDFVASNVNGQNVYSLIFLPDQTFITVEYDNVAGKQVCYKYSKVDPSTIANKKTLTVGGIYIDDQIKEAIIAFNKSNDQYNITVKEYSNSEDPQTAFAADIVAGNIPDIISLDSSSVDQYIGKGILADLSDYFAKEGLDQELLPTVSEAMKVDGKYYYVAPGFSISTLVANSDIVHGKTGWTVAEMMEIIKEQEGKSIPLYYNYRTSMMYTLVYASMTDYVDWMTGECNFDSQEFKDILTICKDLGLDDSQDYDENRESMPSMIQSGKVFLMEQTVDFESTVMMKKMFKDKMTFIGYPCKTGDGSFFQFSSQFGISSKSANQDGAWEFLKTLMTKEYEYKQWYGIPTRKDAYEMYKKVRTTKEAYKDEFGNEIQPLESSWGYDDFEVEIGPLSDEEVALFESVLNNTHRCAVSDYKLLEIIQEEVLAFFKGDKNVDEVAKIIQSRISTYVNENR